VRGEEREKEREEGMEWSDERWRGVRRGEK